MILDELFRLVLAVFLLGLIFMVGLLVAYKGKPFQTKYKNFFNFLWHLPEIVFK